MSYSSNYSIFRAKKLETNSTTKKQENLKNGKVSFRLNIDVRKEKEDSWLNAMKTKIAFLKGNALKWEHWSSVGMCDWQAEHLSLVI